MQLWIAACALLALAANAQVPHFEGETLAGRKITLPQAARGRMSLLIVGFTQASGRQTSEWNRRVQPLSETLLCDVWSVAVLEDVPRLLRGMIVRGIRNGIPKDRQDWFLVVYNHEEELKRMAQLPHPDEAWLVLLDRDGAVKWRAHGAFSGEALSELRKQTK